MRLLHTLLLLVALLAAACGGGDTPAAVSLDDSETTAAADPETEEATEPADDDTEDDDAAAGATVAVASSDLGDILVDGEGRTLYLFTPDDQGDPTCYDDCAANWPAFEGPATAGEGSDDSKLGTAERTDGAQQVTYDGWPLYYFAGDEQAGDVNGQGVGDVWYAVTADGKAAGKGGDDAGGDLDY